MNLLEAIREIDRGNTVESNASRTYTAEDITPITWIGERAVSYRNCGMTDSERKGMWRAV